MAVLQFNYPITVGPRRCCCSFNRECANQFKKSNARIHDVASRIITRSLNDTTRALFFNFLFQIFAWFSLLLLLLLRCLRLTLSSYLVFLRRRRCIGAVAYFSNAERLEIIRDLSARGLEAKLCSTSGR